MISFISFVGARGLSRDTIAPESAGNFSQCGRYTSSTVLSLGDAQHGLNFHPVPRPARPAKRLNAFRRFKTMESRVRNIAQHLFPPLPQGGGFNTSRAFIGNGDPNPNRWGYHLTSQWPNCFAERLIKPETPKFSATGSILMEATT